MRAFSKLPPAARRAKGSLAALLLLVGCSTADATSDPASEPPYRVDPQASERLFIRDDLAARLETAVAEESREGARLFGYGRTGFAKDAAYALRVPFPSHVERVLVGEGDRVKAGQALAELRSSELARLRAELSRAEVKLRIQGQAVERLRPLVADGTATVRELAEAEAELEMAKAGVSSLEQSLSAAKVASGKGDRYVLRASEDGSVIRRNLAPSELVSPDDEPVFLIGDPDRLIVRASFPERDARWLTEGAGCSFTVHALGGERFEGTLTRILPAVDPKTRAVEALCEPKEKGAFAAEMVARVEVEAGGTSQLSLPRRALLMKRDRWVAFVLVEENVIERREVRPGLSLGETVQVLEGIAPGERVVVEGAVLLDGELDVPL